MSYVIGTIYRIYYKLDPTIQYVGSTYTSIEERWTNHWQSYKNYIRGENGEIAIYPYFTQLGVSLTGISDNFEIEKIKDYLVYREDEKDRKHLSAYEQLWINKLRPINKRNAFNPLHKFEQRLKRLRANMTQAQIDKIRASERNENMTQQQIEARNARNRVENISSERREARNARNRVDNMTEEQIQKKRDKEKNYYANMTENQREIKKAANRIENMSSERRERQNAKKRNENMTQEQIEKRKARRKRKIMCIPCNKQINFSCMPDHLKTKRHLKNLEEYNKNNQMNNTELKII
jgi:hypothetical protein